MCTAFDVGFESGFLVVLVYTNIVRRHFASAFIS